MSDRAAAARPRWMLLPLGLFASLAALFAVALTSGDPSKLPSALIGRPAPAMTFEPLEGLLAGQGPAPGFSNADLAKGEPSVVNFWASWCLPCVEEHPFLAQLREKTGIAVYGVASKDRAAAARRFLGRYGNPFTAVGADPSGRGAIEWGVYGTPETFVLNGRGEIVFKHIGPLDASSLATKIVPAIEAARRASKSPKPSP